MSFAYMVRAQLSWNDVLPRKGPPAERVRHRFGAYFEATGKSTIATTVRILDAYVIKQGTVERGQLGQAAGRNCHPTTVSIAISILEEAGMLSPIPATPQDPSERWSVARASLPRGYSIDEAAVRYMQKRKDERKARLALKKQTTTP